MHVFSDGSCGSKKRLGQQSARIAGAKTNRVGTHILSSLLTAITNIHTHTRTPTPCIHARNRPGKWTLPECNLCWRCNIVRLVSRKIKLDKMHKHSAPAEDNLSLPGQAKREETANQLFDIPGMYAGAGGGQTNSPFWPRYAQGSFDGHTMVSDLQIPMHTCSLLSHSVHTYTCAREDRLIYVDLRSTRLLSLR